MSREHIEFALNRRVQRDSAGVREARSLFETRDDVYTTCRGCGRVRTGTKAELMKGCDCGEKSQ